MPRWCVTRRYIALRIALGYGFHTVFTGMLGATYETNAKSSRWTNA
jgi:hypothetical protein